MAIDARLALDQLRHDFGLGVREREDDRVRVHPGDLVSGDHARAGQPEEHVGALHRLVNGAVEALAVGVLGEPLLGGVHALGAAFVDGARRGRSR